MQARRIKLQSLCIQQTVSIYEISQFTNTVTKLNFQLAAAS